MSGSGTGIVTPYNTHRAIDHDGAADGYLRGADLIGNVDGPVGAISCYFRVDGGNGNQRYIFHNQNGRYYLLLGATNQLDLVGRTAVPAIILRKTSTPTYLAGSGWHHLMASWNTTTGASTFLVDGVAVALVNDIVLAGNIDYATTRYAVGQTTPGATRWNGGLSELYDNHAEFIDLTVQANQDQFRHPNGQPPNLLADGSGPTGNQPIVYFVEEGGVMVNRGSGGAIAAVGAPAVSLDSPKDRWVASLNHQRRKLIHHGG